MNITVIHAKDEVLDFAAQELAAYLSRMLPHDGGELSVTLEIVPGSDESANDTFRVHLSPNEGTISGNSGRAVLLGVYDCLHTLGCRFLAPGRENELVPAISLSSIALDYGKTAALRHRGVCIEGADSRENILRFIDWLPKLGYNAFFLQFKTPYVFLNRWYSHLNNPLLPPESFTPEDAEAVMAEAETEMRRRGLMLHKVGHGWTGEVLGYPSLSWDRDPSPLSEDRRPFAAMLGGVRELYTGVPTNTNLCLSNPDAIDRFAGLVVRYAKNNPGTDYLHIWLADEYNNVCECPACREATVSDQYVCLLNEIDRRLSDAGLSTKLVFLLYQELLWPPVRARLAHPERFVLMFAPISRTFESSYDTDGETPPIPHFARNRITLPVSLRENLAFLRGWQAQFAGDSFVYDYPLGRAHYGDLGYVGIARVIHGDIRQLGALGLNGYVSCQELRAALPNTLPNYVMGRALFDGSVSAGEAIDEYFDAAYGERAGAAKAFLSALSAFSRCDYVNGKGPREDEDMAGRMERAAALCKAFCDQAPERAQETDECVAGFLDRLGYHAQVAGLFAGALVHLAKGEHAQACERYDALCGFIRAHEAKYQPWLDVYRIIEVTRKYTGF